VNNVQEVLTGLKSLKDAGTVAGMIKNSVLEQAIKHYEKLQQESKIDRVQVVLQIIITQEDIDGIMVSALEGGINYWCRKVDVDGKYLGEYASEQIGRVGTLILHDMEEDRNELLTKEKLLQGIRMYAELPKHGDIFEVIDHELHIDCGMVDAEVADAIVQYAIFSEIFYG
jgi:hypothetical protein